MNKKIYFIWLILLTAVFPFAACVSDAGKTPENPAADSAPAADTAVIELEQTPAPTLTDRTFLSADRYCIAGKGADGAKLRIEGGVYPVSGEIIDGQFIIEVFLENQNSKDVILNIYAAAEGMAESEPLTVTVSRRESRESRPLYIGPDNQIHYVDTLDDFLGRGRFSIAELALIKNGAENLQRQLTDAGLDTKLIIFISPNPSTIYPETMPAFLFDQIESDITRLKQFDELFTDSDSIVKYINPSERLIKEKENNFVYNRTDTHWNELGAYFGYCEIFDYIAETFPDAKPIPLDDFYVYRSVVRGGDLIPMLRFDQDEVNENAYVVRIKNPSIPELFRGGTDEISYQEAQYHGFLEYTNSNTGDKNLPVIIMYRDSFSISMMSPIAETSKRIIFNNMWDYNINIDYIKAINPDFIIVQKVERIMHEFPGIFRGFR